MKSRISMFFSVILLSATLPTIQAMQPAKRFVRGTKKQFNNWLDAIGQTINGEASSRDAQMQIIGMDPFKNLSNPEQAQIILLLNDYDRAQSLATAARTINSLAQVNKQLNALINDPQFCLQLTKHLAYQFNSSNQEIWAALKTDCAKKNLLSEREYQKQQFPLGEELYNLSINSNKMGPIATVRLLQSLLDRKVNLERMYKNEGTALIVAIYHSNFDLACGLLEAGANPLATDAEGTTALDIAKMMGNNELIQCIEQAIKR